MYIKFYDISQESTWDSFLSGGVYNGTFLHTRKYLSYHKDRYIDQSIIVFNNKHNPIAIFPAAEDLDDHLTVISHPGITYGGLIVGPFCRGEELIDALSSICKQYKEKGYHRLIYKAVPHIYHSQTFQDDLYALFRLNALRYRCDLSSCINLKNCRNFSENLQRNLNKAKLQEIKIDYCPSHAREIWGLLSKLLKEKYGTNPVHNIDEIIQLERYFPRNIKFGVAILSDEVIAGTVLYLTDRVVHTQYMITSDLGRKINALKLLIESCINITRELNIPYFDFGNSNERQGAFLNQGLFRFKNQFGGGSVVHEYYEINLKEF